MIVDRQGDIVRTSVFDELEGKMVQRVTYDNSDVLDLNEAEKKARPEGFGKYKGNMVHVGRIHVGDIERLKNLGYNMLSPDPDEVRRALLYIQSEETRHLTVEGRPFAKHRNKWQ